MSVHETDEMTAYSRCMCPFVSEEILVRPRIVQPAHSILILVSPFRLVNAIVFGSTNVPSRTERSNRKTSRAFEKHRIFSFSITGAIEVTVKSICNKGPIFLDTEIHFLMKRGKLLRLTRQVLGYSREL